LAETNYPSVGTQWDHSKVFVQEIMSEENF
jgi:hypothetical protein